MQAQNRESDARDATAIRKGKPKALTTKLRQSKKASTKKAAR
ncbi:hypothetical protein [Bradyrhizobium sp. CCBAU 45389]|nr:hypothetical protein [Bradyrhizobium sp. CCBAU 45389]